MGFNLPVNWGPGVCSFHDAVYHVQSTKYSTWSVVLCIVLEALSSHALLVDGGMADPMTGMKNALRLIIITTIPPNNNKIRWPAVLTVAAAHNHTLPTRSSLLAGLFSVSLPLLSLLSYRTTDLR